MADEAGPDEMYCRSCGTVIKRRAAYCPACGVANEHGDRGERRRGRTEPGVGETARESPRETDGSRSIDEHDPDAYTADVSGNWHYGVAASVALGALPLVLPDSTGVAFLPALIAWGLMPASVYFDHQWLRATTTWNPDRATWVLLTVIPGVSLVAGIVYLLRRRDADRVSTPDRGRTERVAGNDGELARLRERYSEGELTHAEFEREVERVLDDTDADRSLERTRE